MTKCERCPVPEGRTCIRWIAGHAAYCNHVGTPNGDAMLLAESAAADGVEIIPAAPIDPLSILIDTCPFLASCSCADLRRCLQFGLPAYVSRATCRSCVSEAAP